MKILAAVVTHNRADLLKRCLIGIMDQSRQPDQIIVINNGSTDHTESILLELGITFVNQPNLGSAGGWNKAIDFALKGDFDAIWLMDDDGFPASNALQILETSLDPGISCVSSVVVKENEPNEFVFAFPWINKKGIPRILFSNRKMRNFSELIANSFMETYPFVHLFNGALISTSAIHEIGNVNINYFMYGDESDYYFRLLKAGKVMTNLEAKHFHPDVLDRKYSDLRVYYHIKNNIINYRKYYNFIFIRQIFAPLLVLNRIIKTNGLKYACSLIFGPKSRIFYKAIYRGFCLRVGKDF